MQRTVRVATASVILCFLIGLLVPSAPASSLTMDEYVNAVLNKQTKPVYYSSQPPAPSLPVPPADQPPAAPPTAQPPAAGSYTSSKPVQSMQDYYNAVMNKQSRPVYYGSQPTAPSSPPTTPPPTTPPAPAELTAAEARLLELINLARSGEGVQPVEIDLKLVEIARIKARDMQANNYFGHVSPTYGYPGQMLRTFGVSFRSAGENLSKAGDVYKAHLLLLNSTKGHREIMLDPDFSKVGIAVLPVGSYVLVVEIFVQP